MRVSANHRYLQYTGRIGRDESGAPVMIYPCTSVRLRFTGDVLRVHVRNRRLYWENSMGCLIDGALLKLDLPKEGEAVLEIPVHPAKPNDGQGGCGYHDALLFKRQDACHEVTILGFEIEDGAEILDPPTRPERRIEVYGDSVSAGEVSEAVEYTGREDPEHNGQYSNSWYSYAWMTARKLGAEIHDIAQGGIALLDGTGWFHEPDSIGMESVWDKIRYNPEFGSLSEWDFSRYTPRLVIVAVGQNDSHPEDYMKEDYNSERAQIWRSGYRSFLENIRGKYPDAWIVCITTLLMHDASWDRSIEEVCKGMNDGRIRHYLFERNGAGTPGHLRIPEAREMAEELSGYINSLGIDW